MVDPVALPTKDVRNQNNSANPMTQTPSQVSSYPTAWDQAMPPHGFAPKRQKQFFFINSREIIPLRIYLKNGSVYFFSKFFFRLYEPDVANTPPACQSGKAIKMSPIRCYCVAERLRQVFIKRLAAQIGMCFGIKHGQGHPKPACLYYQGAPRFHRSVPFGFRPQNLPAIWQGFLDESAQAGGRYSKLAQRSRKTSTTQA